MANARRLELQSKFEEFLGNGNVYYQPPESVKMQYDAIRYSLKDIDIKFADNALYATKRCYKIILITRKPDSDVIDKLLELPYCTFDRHYYADNLNHYVFTLYY